MKSHLRYVLCGAAVVGAVVCGIGVSGDDGERLLSLDHYVKVKSTVPVMTPTAMMSRMSPS